MSRDLTIPSDCGIKSHYEWEIFMYVTSLPSFTAKASVVVET